MLTALQIRAELARLRKAHYPKIAPFARATGMNRNTVMFLEDESSDPDRMPGLETIGVWLQATSGESVGAFLSRLESGVRPGAYPVTAQAHDVSLRGDIDATGFVQRADAADIHLLQRVAIAILHLVGAPELPPKD